MHNSDAQTLPKLICVGFLNFAFLVRDIRYHLTQTMPSRDRPPAPQLWGRSQLRLHARTERTPVLVRPGSLGTRGVFIELK